MNLFLYNVILNILVYISNFFFINLNEFRNTQNHFLCYVTSAFKWWLSNKNTQNNVGMYNISQMHLEIPFSSL